MARPALQRLVTNVSPALQSLLNPARGAVLGPIRSEIFGLQRFAQHGRSLGDTHRAGRASSFAATFFPRLRDNITVLREAHRYIGTQASTGYDISPAAEWLLDNFHLVEAQLKAVHEGLPRSYFHALPVLLDEPLAGLPRIYGVAWAFVAHTDGAFDEELLVRFLCAYQDSRELNLGEMWALPTTLRVVLVENLRRLAERVATNKAAREVANLCCDHIDDYTVPVLAELLELLYQRGVGRVFLAQMAQRLQDVGAGPPDGEAAARNEWLRAALPDSAAALAQQGTDQAADNLSVSNAVSSLRAIGDADWPGIVARSSALMRLMLCSPMFAAEDVTTRDDTLHAIEGLARRSGRSEVAVAQLLLERLHRASGDDAVAGHWLGGSGRPELLAALGVHEEAWRVWRRMGRHVALPAYLAALLAGTLMLLAWVLNGSFGPWTWLAALLMLVPASEAVVALINRLISESARPQHLPRLALAEGLPAEHRVMVVIPGMLTDAASTHALSHRLHLHHLANPERHAQFALLTDWADADGPHSATDQTLLDEAVHRIEWLNVRYPEPPASDGSAAPPRFILLHRPRTFSESEQRWIGWERKRGKLEQLLAALAEPAAPSPFIDLGERSRCAAGTPYIVTLDSDTQLPPGRLRELVGVAAHPRNQPRLDVTGRSVVAGFGILQPRVAIPLPAPKEFTRFHWLFAGQCGIDPYSAASSEVYQDLFGEGTFTGKGLLNVKALHAVLHGRLPEGQVLSHDLLEGSMARCAAVSDITLLEDAPFHADVAASRVHRWTRGDWQLLPFLLGRQHGSLRAVNRWKMFDNLRRSLVMPTSLALLVVALAGALHSPWAALGLVFAAFTAGPLMGAVAGFSPSRDDIAKLHFYRQAAIDLGRALGGGLWHLAMLLQHALLAVDAVVRALWRMAVSHRHLLQWTTAAAAQAQARSGVRALIRRHWSLPVVSLLLAGALLAGGTPHPVATTLLCLMWALSPVWTWWVSCPRSPRKDATLPPEDQAELHGIARDTWRFFERCVGAADLHLPPDNLQTAPHDMLAHRTSPTNIGLYLLSAACAREFGWIGTVELLARLQATMATLDGLQRHRGHFLNWYDTQTAMPLLPMYVSTVDSGNLIGHLLAVAEACRAIADAPLDAAASAAARSRSLGRLAPLLAGRSGLTPAQREQLRWCLADHRANRDSALLDSQAAASGQGDETGRQLRVMAERCERLAWQAEFGFLYHPKRHLLHIGYRVAEQQLDAGFYDLLASESRLTSLLAVARGDVPVSHWASLGRPFFAVGGQAGLRSWSGSMFEYLLPGLVLHEPQGSVLHDACDAALCEQIAYTSDQGMPWGISESAYAGSDHTLAYQYAPQGVPRLALRRTPADELVIAPYATALAAMIAPHRACQNFAALTKLSARARYGYIEALDYSPARQTDGRRCTLVHTFMAHHQGMSIVALANVLLGGVAQRWGMANPHIEAVVSLLHERAPREVSTLSAPPAAPTLLAVQRRTPGLLREVEPGSSALEPTHLLSNGRYSVTLRANGAGWSRWGTQGITRWRDDALRDAHGSFFFLRWARLLQSDSPLASITQHPAPDPAAHYRSTFHADRVCFDAAWPHMQAHTTVWVSPEDDIEFRQVELRNLGSRPLDIELSSAFEVTLADDRADEAHPAFSNLFVRAEWWAGPQALWFERRPRLATERGLQMAFFLAQSDPQVISVRGQTDRQHWAGRNRAANQPLATFDPLAPALEGAVGDMPSELDTGLDPVCALAVRLRIAPHGNATLTFATAASDDGGTLRAVIDKYRQAIHVQRASLMSATLTGIRLRELRISADSFAAMQSLSSALLMCLTRPPSAPARGAGTPPLPSDRRLLWRLGISGDRPLILVTASIELGLGMLRSLAQALRLWNWGGVACDLVVVNAEPASYEMALQRELVALRARHIAECSGAQASTAFHVRSADELSGPELATLKGLARVRLHADSRPLALHVQEWIEGHDQDFELRHATSTSTLATGTSAASDTLAPTGQFDAVSGEFSFDVGTRLRPARPWINVLANPGFGAQISEAGGGYTWARNSRLNQLTAWSNDAVADPPSEWFLVQDLKTLQVWHVAPSAWSNAASAHGAPAASHQVSHGQGRSRISHQRGDLDISASWCVDASAAVKQVRLRIVNHGPHTQRLRLVALAEWMMGGQRADRATVHTARAKAEGTAAGGSVLLATQREASAGFGDGTAFLSLVQPEANAASGRLRWRGRYGTDSQGEQGDRATDDEWTCDRREFFDARGRLVLPDHLGRRSGSGLDPCAALSTTLVLPAGGQAERVFLIGYGDSPQTALELATSAAAKPADQREAGVLKWWDDLLGATTVQTPDPLFDAMVNRWLIYQTVSCRLWAKAGFYQAGGATGFRDQLQDAMALTWAAPDLLREQIVLCASRQFPEGDVQHWWHAPLGAGVRTHFSDDLLWLPHALLRYRGATGDDTLLDQRVPFIEGAAIPEGAEDAYYTPSVSEQDATVYEHAARAIDRSLRVGLHGLPLMGTGDWNDGMNRVGHEGRGESVWLGWFLCRLVADFAPLARQRGEAARAERWLAAAEGWTLALNRQAWDGQWFKRAFFDDGQALGSSANPEARIDLIAQAWSVFAGATPPALQRLAMAAVEEHLVDPHAGLIKLLDPPLAHALPSAGYIQAYPPGVRENGGQYSHAGVWALMAQAQTGDTQAAWESFQALSPAHRSQHPTRGPAYELEPYVMAGDIYGSPPYVGRGGWSWYTGSAAWLHRASVETLLGLSVRQGVLSLSPRVPAHWPAFEITLRLNGERVVMLRWQRAGVPTEGAGFMPDRELAEGETVVLASLPTAARLLVRASE